MTVPKIRNSQFAIRNLFVDTPLTLSLGYGFTLGA
jgi:hypothetical protein